MISFVLDETLKIMGYVEVDKIEEGKIYLLSFSGNKDKPEKRDVLIKKVFDETCVIVEYRIDSYVVTRGLPVFDNPPFLQLV